MTRASVFAVLLLAFVALPRAQDHPPFQTDFPAEEFAERRSRVMDAIGRDAIAILQGAAGVDGFKVFRQSNEFYYLTGLETPHAYLVLDGRSRRTTLYLPQRNEALERSTGPMWSAEDADDVKRLTGVDAVAPVSLLSRQTFGTMLRPPAPRLYLPFSPAEGEAQSRDELLAHQAGVAGDPWDGRPSREAHFLRLLEDRYPALEAMKSTRPGVFEYQVAAVARFTFLFNGARFEGYNPIAAGGTNAWMGHYSRNLDPLKAGDMVLMDYAPDLRYYTSDVTRMWPVFTVDPMMWIPDEKLYVRMEDTIVVTADGMENFTASLASSPDEIEAVMTQEGLLRRMPTPSARNGSDPARPGRAAPPR